MPRDTIPAYYRDLLKLKVKNEVLFIGPDANAEKETSAIVAKIGATYQPIVFTDAKTIVTLGSNNTYQIGLPIEPNTSAQALVSHPATKFRSSGVIQLSERSNALWFTSSTADKDAVRNLIARVKEQVEWVNDDLRSATTELYASVRERVEERIEQHRVQKENAQKLADDLGAELK